jgi:hypothetical protein
LEDIHLVYLPIKRDFRNNMIFKHNQKMEVMLMKKRMLVLALSVLTLFAVAGFDQGIKANGLQPSVAPSSDVAPAATTTTGFSDIKGHWGEKYILEALTKGYVSGYPDGTFQPNGMVTRAELLAMTTNALHLPVSAAADGEAWYTPYVKAATSAGL